MEKSIQFINQNFNLFLSQYDLGKYPSEIYETVKNKFSSLKVEEEAIRNALEWKWGHIGKSNYPVSHKELIKDISKAWIKFILSKHDKSSAKKNFDWWKNNIDNPQSTRFITIAFVIHLIHHEEIPIIDQHNYRALNFFSNNLKLSEKFKKKPSKWEDIMMLKQFTDEILPNLSNKNPEDFDKFLMMFGKSIKKNKRQSA